MMSAALFPSILGPEFSRLAGPLQWVHGGEARTLHGVVTVERGASFLSKALGAMARLPVDGGCPH